MVFPYHVCDVERSFKRWRYPVELCVNIMNLKSEEHYDIDGIYPAYHMNHKTWISVVLDDTICDDKIMELIQSSFDLTK